ncbi:MAG TPA: hypothetical protein VIL20_07270 [Sandaracinaceae bacterium]
MRKSSPVFHRARLALAEHARLSAEVARLERDELDEGERALLASLRMCLAQVQRELARQHARASRELGERAS